MMNARQNISFQTRNLKFHSKDVLYSVKWYGKNFFEKVFPNYSANRSHAAPTAIDRSIW